MEPITIVLIVMTSLNTLLHGYHLSRSSCIIDKCGLKLHIGISPNPKAGSQSGILDQTPEMVKIATGPNRSVMT